MKTLYLIRHAKSSWNREDLTDFERPLNKRGLKNAPFMAQWLAKQEIPKPKTILASPAVRAKTTATEFAKAYGLNKHDIQLEPRIYEAFIPDLRAVVESIPDHIQTALLVGHNPAITEFSEYLTQTTIGNMPTCSICGIRLTIDSWQETTSQTGHLDFFVFPKALQ